MLSDSTLKNRYSYDESRNLSSKCLLRCYKPIGRGFCWKCRLMINDSGSVANPSESLCHCVTSPFGKGGLTISLRRFQSLTSVAYGATSFPRKEANE